MANTTLSKNRQGYGYKYTDLSQIHEYLESVGLRYYQYIEPLEGQDYVYTVPLVVNEDGSITELAPRRGCRIVQATLSGKSNPAQENGSAITYARRYSLLMAFGLATEDDDAQSLTQPKNQKQNTQPKQASKPDKIDEQLNAPVDPDMLPQGQGMTETRIKKLKLAQKFTGKNDKTILATAHATSFETITEASYIALMELFSKLLTPEQQAEIEAIK